MSNAGTAGWRLFTDALDEAHAAGFTGDRRRSGRPKRHLADIEMKQLKQAEQIRRRLDKQLIAMGPDWVPDETFMNAHAQATQSISSLSRSLRLAKKAEHETRSKLTPDELDAAFLIELRRIAMSCLSSRRRICSACLSCFISMSARWRFGRPERRRSPVKPAA